MYRSISLLLALVMMFSLLCGCSQQIGLETNSTSSNKSAEEYLYENLDDDHKKDIILGTEEKAAEYDIDMTGFRDEGYIIRTNGDDILIFGKAEEGLDRAVRYYVKNCANLNSADVVYGDGYKVKKIEIGGRDISEFDIYLFPGADECHNTAASELQLYIEKACGIRLDIVSEKTDHMIILEQVLEDDARYESLGNEGFTISVRDDGNLYITGGKWRGCLYGVYEFLEEYIGWRFIVNHEIVKEITSDSYYLYESDLIEIPVGLEDTQIPSFEYRQSRFSNIEEIAKSTLSVMHKENDAIRNKPEYNGYSFGDSSNHGLLKGPIKNKYFTLDFVSDDVLNGKAQPCFTNEDVINASIDYYTDTIEAQLALGYEIGKEINQIDVAQNDTANFCTCKTCLSYVKIDRSNTGPVLYFTNTLAEHFGNEYPGLYVSMFAYWGTTKPPQRTVPLDNVSVAYCFYNDIEKVNCYNHAASAEFCHPVESDKYDYKIGNTEYAEEFEGWCEIASRITVWIYPGNWNFSQISAPRLHVLREEINYFYEQGVYGIYPCMASGSRDTLWDIQDYLVAYLLLECQWNAEMTKEEYWGLIEEYLTILYGDGSTFIMDYLYWQIDAAKDSCWTLQCYSSPDQRMDFSKISEDFEKCISFFDTALSFAESSYHEDGIVLLSRSMYLAGLVACHDPWYLNGTTAQKERYTEIYNEFKELSLETGYSLDEKILTEEHFDIEVNLAKHFPSNQYVRSNWWNWVTT